MAKSFESHARTVSLLTLLSRVTGLARDATLTRVFGAGPLMDAFNFGFQVPNLFRRLFGEGALTASFLPVYTRLERDNPALASAFAGVLLGGITVVLAIITLVGEALLWVLPRDGADGGIGLSLLMIMLPYMPLVCLTALLGAVLQVHQRFGPTAAAPILLNLAIVATALLMSDSARRLVGWEALQSATHIQVVAWSVVVAGVGQVLWSLAALRRARVPLSFNTAGIGEPLRTTLRQALPMLLGLGVFQINTAIDSLIASWRTIVGPTVFGVEWPLAEGSLTFLNCAQRLYEFPLGVFGIAVATAIFPAFARQASDPAAFIDTLRRGLRLTLFIALPASAGLIALREPLAATLFQGGRFTASDSAMVSWVLLGYAPAIWAYSTQQVATRAFYAQGDSLTPMRVALGMVGLNLTLNLILIWTPLGVAGLAWSTALTAMVQVAIILKLLARKTGPIMDGEVWRSVLRSLGVAIATGAVALIMASVSGRVVATETWAGSALALAVGTGAGVAALLVSSRGLGSVELRWALRGRSEGR
ncbi:MAG: murein biosynthesis integral membrane protein MurJ [Phycisphaeraceae bacterium]|nr:murein biosynthesis integral membrane protein MurJ [Phycisphaeraceae bacterium]